MQQLALLAALGACAAVPAMAEPPMHVDDAGTLDKGGMKIEGAVSRDHKERGGELLFGFAPVEDVEIGIGLARATDRADDPSTRLRGTGISIKWVPLKSDAGWSLGASLAYGRTRVEERATPVRFTEKEIAFSGLATYRFASAQVVHLNLGAVRVKAQGESDTLGTWGIGFEQPLAEKQAHGRNLRPGKVASRQGARPALRSGGRRQDFRRRRPRQRPQLRPGGLRLGILKVGAGETAR